MTKTIRSPRKRRCPLCGRRIRSRRLDMCQHCGGSLDGFYSASETDLLALPEMRYQNAYVWLVLVSALDIILTMLIVHLWPAREVNPLAAAIISVMGFGWAIVFKLATILLVIVMCEVVGRYDDRAGFGVVIAGIILNGLVVCYTLLLMFLEPPGG